VCGHAARHPPDPVARSRNTGYYDGRETRSRQRRRMRYSRHAGGRVRRRWQRRVPGRGGAVFGGEGGGDGVAVGYLRERDWRLGQQACRRWLTRDRRTKALVGEGVCALSYQKRRGLLSASRAQPGLAQITPAYTGTVAHSPEHASCQ